MTEFETDCDDHDVTESDFTLSHDQQVALDMFVKFLLDPVQQVFVLEGYSGTGKSTLVKVMMDNMHKYLKTAKLLNSSSYDYEIQLTAMTNKAAEVLSQVSGMHAITIHSFLGLRVVTNYRTGESELIPKDATVHSGYLIIIDEASMMDSPMIRMLFEKTSNCKIMFIGDPAQLLQVKASSAPVFSAGFTTAKLTEVMRQKTPEGEERIHPITAMATQFRNTVNTGIWTNVKVDGEYIVHLNQSDFEDAILKEFLRPDWRYNDSKVLAWRNSRVIEYNHAINDHRTGNPEFVEGDYVVCNSHISCGRNSIKTDQLVHITKIEDPVMVHGVLGNYVTVDYLNRAFYPKSMSAKLERIKQAKANEEIRVLQEIDERWFDLRAAYAQTVNKSQGSTYDQVFIDLNDISRCTVGDQIARMMYVGPSRARNRVTLTGDFT